MASRFVVAVALFAVCHSSIVDVAYRDKRSFTNAEGFAESLSGSNQASAAVNGLNSKAYGFTNEGGKALAKANTNDAPNSYIAPNGYVAIGQPNYYNVPAPATIVTYQKQYADVPAETPSHIVYDGAGSAQSSAVTNGAGYGSAISNANTAYGTAASDAKAYQGAGLSSATSHAQTNGLLSPIPSPETFEPTIVAARNQGFYHAYTPVNQNSASSNANVNGQGSASSSAKVAAGPTRKSISWRFGTAYDHPASYVKSTANNQGYGSASANSNVNNGNAYLKSNANSQGASSAKSTADSDGARYGTNSAAYSTGGSANANADINNANYYAVRGLAGNSFDRVRSSANSVGQGAAQSSAINNPGAYGLRSAEWGSGRIGSQAQTRGNGNADSSVQIQGAGYRLVNSAAKSSNWGAADANAYSN